MPSGLRFPSIYQFWLCTLLLIVWSATTRADPSFSSPINFGSVNTFDLWEASGLVASRQNPGVLWTHNDSGYAGTVFALSTNGTFLGRWQVPAAPTGDYEDIAIGPGPDPSRRYLYLGDIGDNFLSRASITIYRFPEPAIYAFTATNPVYADLQSVETIVLQYPDGAHNAEAMLVDPWTADLFIITKLDASARVYRATRQEMAGSSPITLTYLTEISFRKVSAADISPDGTMIALRRGSTGALWTRSPGQTVDQALANGPFSIPMATEPNGEAIAFDSTSTGYFTISEGYTQPIYFYPRTDVSPVPPRAFVPPAAYWLYEDSGSVPDENWYTLDAEDWFYSEGIAPFGYNSGEATTLQPGFPNKSTTTYFHGWFYLRNIPSLTNLALRLSFNDGVAVYLNGKEVLRRNLASNANSDSYATNSNESMRSYWQAMALDPALLRLGSNLLAVEVHRTAETAALNFDAQLVEAYAEFPRRFLALPHYEKGKWNLSVTGPPGVPITVERSSDLNTWSPVGSPIMIGEQMTIQDNNGGSLKFYRILP